MLKKLMFVAAFLGLAGLSANVYAQEGGSNSLTDASRDITIKLMYNQDAVTHATGTVVTFVGAPTATYPGLSVSTTVTPYNIGVAGVVYGKTLPANGWGYIQTHGYNPAVNVASATLLGDLLWTSATAGSAAAHSGVSVSSEATSAFGIALSVNASSAAIPALILR